MKIVVLENLVFNADHFVSGGLIRMDPRDSAQMMQDTAAGKEPDPSTWPVFLQVFLAESQGGADIVNVTLDKSQPVRRSSLQRYTVAGTDTEGTIDLYLSMLEQLGCNPKYLPTKEKAWEFLGGKPAAAKILEMVKPQATQETGREEDPKT